MVSIIVPVYNTGKYLYKCVDSILAQTYQNFELILVNDGSTDGSPGICDQYASQDNRVYVIHQTNQGQAAARNHAVIQATGEWILVLDADELVTPELWQYLIDFTKNTKSRRRTSLRVARAFRLANE